ncbi:GGDEF domain-containing protein [Marinobacterium aestuariivivens]|uniref:diguanylate cyclase n=1 Tax=Marinobacterium aestuariivivens TaxID=1698799 RepID=A0ABW1ZYA4_9GAMM
MSMLLLDIDHFKAVNDRFGHQTGDEALRAVARLCQETLRDCDLFARVGGEEFAALLPSTTEREARAVSERLRGQVALRVIPTRAGEVGVTISIGVSEFRADDDFKSLYNRADQALYRAKNAGRNRVMGSDTATALNG